MLVKVVAKATIKLFEISLLMCSKPKSAALKPGHAHVLLFLTPLVALCKRFTRVRSAGESLDL